MEPEFSSESEMHDWEVSHAGKVGYPTQNAAEAHAELEHHGIFAERKDFPRSRWELLEAYKCRWCPDWHLGHIR